VGLNSWRIDRAFSREVGFEAHFTL
jgi:hypothetical protein